MNWVLIIMVAGVALTLWWLFNTFQTLDIMAGFVIASLLFGILWFAVNAYAHTRRGDG